MNRFFSSLLLAVVTACLIVVFVLLIKIKQYGKAYVFEDNPFILNLEIVLITTGIFLFIIKISEWIREAK